MMTEKYILSIDAGTQSIRAVLVSPQGDIVDIEKVKMQAYFSKSPGWAEQDVDYMWSVLVKATKTLIDRIGNKKDLIEAVTLTTQRGTVVNLDKDNKVLRPAIIWLDRRQAMDNGWASFFTKAGLKLVNMYGAATYAYQEAELNWIKQNQPEVWNNTSKFLLLSGYFNYKLTGKHIDSIGSQVGYVPFDYKKHKWIESKNDIKRKMFDIELDKLPELIEPTQVVGMISQSVSDETGIPRGLKVIAASSDKSAEVLGSGVVDNKTACLSYGTTATVQTVSEKYIELRPFIPPYPSAIPKFYNTEVMVYRGFWMIDWFKNEFGSKEVEKAKKIGIAPEELLDKLICDIPPGSMGLVLQPFWSAGVKNPGLEAKGSIIGFGDVHTRAHIYRAIIEGLAFALRNGFEHTIKKTGFKVDTVRVSGGGSQSDNIMQITADIFGIPAERPHTYETSALGAAIDAAVGIGWYKDFDSAITNMTRLGEVFYPNKENHKLYNKVYYKVYNKMYSRLKPLYDDIREIFNYPEM